MTKWKQPEVPRHVVQMFIVDDYARFFTMRRTENVRSAKNVWTLPTGTHEIGETAAECVARELNEELGLVPSYPPSFVFQYENIAGDFENLESPQYHWVLSVFNVRVPDLSAAVNNEPLNHDSFTHVPIIELMSAENPRAAINRFLVDHPYHSSLHAHLEGGYLKKCMWDAAAQAWRRQKHRETANFDRHLPPVVTPEWQQILNLSTVEAHHA